MNIKGTNIILLLLVLLLAIIPLLIVKDSEFEGADDAAGEMIEEISPDYEPWFDFFWEPPGGETESLLFALQAALGAGFLGYYIGNRRGRAQE